MTEHTEQCAVIEWCNLQSGAHPELELIYAVPNAGKRTKRQGAWMKDEGMKAGVPDLFLPVARDGYHGLYIELKIGKNKPTDSQVWWLERLTMEGYLAVVCWGYDDAVETISKYVGIER